MHSLLDGVKTDASPAERLEFQEESGIESETSEMLELDSGDLCKPPAPKKLMLAGGKIAARTNGQLDKPAPVALAAPGDKRKRA